MQRSVPYAPAAVETATFCDFSYYFDLCSPINVLVSYESGTAIVFSRTFFTLRAMRKIRPFVWFGSRTKDFICNESLLFHQKLGFF